MAVPLKDQRQPWQGPQATRSSSAAFVEARHACFRLRPSAAAVSQGFVRLLAQTSDGSDRLCIAPAFASTSLIVFNPGGAATLRCHGQDVVIEPAGLWARISQKLRAVRPSYRKAALRFGSASLHPEGDRRAVRDYRKLLKFASASGMAFDGETLRLRPELALGFADAEASHVDARDRAGPSTAVVLHLHYIELWPEFAALLKRWRAPFQLFVTLTREDAALAHRIVADFPGSKVDIVENKGRDVRPFLQLLESGAFDPFELVCKVHGKRSLRAGASPLFGEMFRRAALLDLIGGDAQVEDIQNRFAEAPELGLIGPERFRARSRHGDAAEVMGASRATIEALAKKMDAQIVKGEFDVFHGTMFWVRPRALARLRALDLAANGFSSETGRDDGAMEHAVEGLFNLAVRAAGFKVAGTSF